MKFYADPIVLVGCITVSSQRTFSYALHRYMPFYTSPGTSLPSLVLLHRALGRVGQASSPQEAQTPVRDPAQSLDHAATYTADDLITG